MALRPFAPSLLCVVNNRLEHRRIGPPFSTQRGEVKKPAKRRASRNTEPKRFSGRTRVACFTPKNAAQLAGNYGGKNLRKKMRGAPGLANPATRSLSMHCSSGAIAPHAFTGWKASVYFLASSASIALSTSGSSGLVRGAKRATTSPLRPIRNFSKFQVILPAPLGLVSRAVRCL